MYFALVKRNLFQALSSLKGKHISIYIIKKFMKAQITNETCFLPPLQRLRWKLGNNFPVSPDPNFRTSVHHPKSPTTGCRILHILYLKEGAAYRHFGTFF